MEYMIVLKSDDSPIVGVSVHNLTGIKIKTLAIEPGSLQVLKPSLTSGMYFFKIVLEDNQTLTQKVIVR